MFLRINPLVILDNPFSPAAVSWRVPRDVKLLCDGPSRIKEQEIKAQYPGIIRLAVDTYIIAALRAGWLILLDA